MIHSIRTAWKAFEDCHKVAVHFGLDGHWERLSLTRSQQEFDILSSKMPEPMLHKGNMFKYLSEGVYWLHLMQRYADQVKTVENPETKIAAEHAIACFGFARKQYGYLQEEDCEAP